jgi:cell division protein FtsL
MEDKLVVAEEKEKNKEWREINLQDNKWEGGTFE